MYFKIKGTQGFDVKICYKFMIYLEKYIILLETYMIDEWCNLRGNLIKNKISFTLPRKDHIVRAKYILLGISHCPQYILMRMCTKMQI